MRSALIIGSGPSAAFVVEACREFDVNFTVCSAAPKRPPAGAFWLHDVPKRFRTKKNTFWIDITGIGSAEQYFRKQWGDFPYTSSSFPRIKKAAMGYRSSVINDMMKDVPIIAMSMTDDDIALESKHFDFIFMTGATEASKKTRKITAFPTLTITGKYMKRFCLSKFNTTDVCLCNSFEKCLYIGDDSNIVRITLLDGSLHIELTVDTPTDYINNLVHNFDAAISYSPDIHPMITPCNSSDVPAPNVFLCGRFALWDRKFLSSDSYRLALRILGNS